MFRSSLLLPLALCLATNYALAANCRVVKTDVFEPQNKTVALARPPGAAASANVIVFKSKLRVNTDGAPISYHPADPKGLSKSINNIVNGISIKKPGSALTYGEKIKAFERFRDSAWIAPNGYKISWGNVIATITKKGKKQPCVFSTAPYSGYFGSLTTLKNGLAADNAGECQVNNQLDQRFVPGLVLPSGANPLQAFGAKIGDLVFAFNAANGKSVAAVVADGGPPENLGEGSVAMNMALLGQQTQPTNYAQAKALDTGNTRIVVAIVPASAGYNLQRPYTADNIRHRLDVWAAANGYGSSIGLSDFLKDCGSKL